MTERGAFSRLYIPCVNALSDKWMVLSHAEIRVMLYILNRTLRWNKPIEGIPRRHILKGVPKIDTGPLGMSYRNWTRCLRVLERAGMIQTLADHEVGMHIEVMPQRILQGPIQRRVRTGG